MKKYIFKGCKYEKTCKHVEQIHKGVHFKHLKQQDCIMFKMFEMYKALSLTAQAEPANARCYNIYNFVKR